MNPFEDMMNDDVYFESADGPRQGPFKTAFSNKGISIFDESLDVVEGDKAIRRLPSGREEYYTITEVSYSSGLGGFGGIPPHFTLKLTKDNAIRPAPAKSTTNHISIHGSQGIQIGDHNVQNLQLALEELIQRIDQSGASREEREEAKNRLATFLAHPLVSSVVGASLPVALGLLS
nr:RIP homotypic interaction motif-containing protein [Pseudomonas chengduensis]